MNKKILKKYIVSAETRYRILKNWIVEAFNKKEVAREFRKKANLSEKSKLYNLKINLQK